MANTLTTLAPTLFSAAKQVAAEPFGIINGIDARFDNKGVAKGDMVTVPVAPTRPEEDFAPSNITQTGDDATSADVEVEITHSKKVSWHLTGEQQRSLENGDTNTDWVSQLVLQGMRTLRNGAERVCAQAVKDGASRAVGTAGTTPFASDLSDMTEARKVLQDNGAPLADLQLAIDSSAGLNLRNLGIIQQADQAGTAEERRSGNLLQQFGFNIKESAGIADHTAGSGSGVLVNGTLAVGDTVITADGGSGTILPGDIVTFAGDTNEYVATSELSNGQFTIGAPGLLAAPADNAAITVGANYVANLGFERSAVVGIMRPPIMPPNPTIMQRAISDNFGMTYLMLDIAQYGQRSWELHLAYGFKAVNGEFISIVKG